MVVKVPYRVIYGDTDQMGVVYYANYLRLFEYSRNEYLRARDMTYREVEARGLMLPVTEANCRYLRPARYDDLITIEVRVLQARGARVRFAYEIKGEAGELLAEGFTVHAAVDGEGRVVRLPADIAGQLAPEE